MLVATETKTERRLTTVKPEQKAHIDATGLESALKRKLKGEVRFDVGSRALYATDGSNYRQVPIGVVIPKDAEDVQETIAACHRFGAPLLSRGGGTSLAGQCCNVAVVMDFSKYMNRIIGIDRRKRLGKVQPGCVLDDLREEASKHQLTFGPDPATHSHCTLGGMLGNNSCGIHSLLSNKHGFGQRTSDNTAELEIITYDGQRMSAGQTEPAELERLIRIGDAKGRIYQQLKALRDEYADPLRTRMPKLSRRVSGYNLDELLPEHHFNVARSLVGSEGTLVTILEATLHLVPKPAANSLLVLGYPDVYSAADHLTEILQFEPIGLEGIDDVLIQWMQVKKVHVCNLKLMPKGNGFLFVQFGGDSKADSNAQAARCMARLKKEHNAPDMRLYDEQEEEEKLWKVRESGLSSTAWIPTEPDNWPGFEDSAVPVENVGQYLRGLKKLMQKYEYKTSLYGHLGQGCIHCRIPFDLYTAEGVRRFKSFMDEASDLVVSLGGSISGEHGDGQARAPYIEKMFGPDLMDAFRKLKQIWDPHWKMNPGKVIDAFPVDANLRIGPDYSPPDPKTHFSYSADKWTFARAPLRCVGVGDCRKKSGLTMCPSYQVTLEEEHCTRGRARLLWEMLNGREIKDGWKSEAVKHSLDLCLSCKGCKGDCPVQVDMATYKAEFLSHYYKGRFRPRQAYAFGLIHLWARLASRTPTLANIFTQSPLLRSIAKWIAGVAPQRYIPPFAPQSFKQWFANRARLACSRGLARLSLAEAGKEVPISDFGSRISDLSHYLGCNRNAPSVILFADTFNNYFHTEVAKSAVEVLEDAGFQVLVPVQDMCCGRPLYDYGMLDRAKLRLIDIISALRPTLQIGIPIVVLEPSCCAVFRDELINLFPNNSDAKRLSELALTFGEFLQKHAPDYKVPRLAKLPHLSSVHGDGESTATSGQPHAIVQGHCHQKALMGLDCDLKLLKVAGVDFKVLDSGCCGMAGSFGFEPGDHYDVSMKCGERVLLPAVREAGEDTLIVADGFSCKTQIEQATDRRALHLAQVLQLGLRQRKLGPETGRPEAPFIIERDAQFRAAGRRAATIALSVATIGLLAWSAYKSSKRT